MSPEELLKLIQVVLGFGLSTLIVLLGVAYRVGKAATKIENAADMVVDHERRITQLEHVNVKYASLFPRMRDTLGELK